MSSNEPQAARAPASSRIPWPPIVYGTAALLAGLLTWLVPFGPGAGGTVQRLLGIAVILAGLALGFSAVRLFRRAGTPAAPIRPSTALVTGGIYRWTRNPMYLGMSCILAGLGIATGSLWFIAALPLAVFAVTKLAIEREEAYLTRLFAGAYLDYKSRVRRWF
jgi:protein-S-isoprenylcysteine O-methyltransferase Ste14